MQVVGKVVAYFLLLVLALVILMPKEELYFSLEKTLAKQGIEINEAKIEEGPFSLKLKDVTVYAKGIKVAKIQQIRCFTVLFYTSVVMNEMVVDKGLKSILPARVEKVRLTHSVLSPLKVKIKGRGSFGTASGTISLRERKIHIDLADTGKLGVLRSQLKHGKEGWYYETTY